MGDSVGSVILALCMIQIFQDCFRLSFVIDNCDCVEAVY